MLQSSVTRKGGNMSPGGTTRGLLDRASEIPHAKARIGALAGVFRFATGNLADTVETPQGELRFGKRPRYDGKGEPSKCG